MAQKIDLSKTWKRVKTLNALESKAESDHEDREASELRAQRRQAQGEISKAATDFLKAHGFTGGGQKVYSRKIPGLNC